MEAGQGPKAHELDVDSLDCDSVCSVEDGIQCHRFHENKPSNNLPKFFDGFFAPPTLNPQGHEDRQVCRKSAGHWRHFGGQGPPLWASRALLGARSQKCETHLALFGAGGRVHDRLRLL